MTDEKPIEWEIANAHFLRHEWAALGQQMFHTAVRSTQYGGPMVLVFGDTFEQEDAMAEVIRLALTLATQAESREETTS